MIIDPYRYAAAPSANLLLDETGIGSAFVALSVARKLRNAYAGSAIRVRRSSDDAEQDIGFSGNVLDESSLTTFIGAGNGFVTTIYDQSGNGLNVTQTTKAIQPAIATSGVIIKDNSKPAMSFPGTGYNLRYDPSAISAENNTTIQSVCHGGDNDGANYLKCAFSVGANGVARGFGVGYGFYNSAADARKPAIIVNSSATNAVSSTINNNQVMMIGVVSGASQSLYENNNSVVTATSDQTLQITSDGVFVAVIPALSFGLLVGALWQESVAWMSNLDAYAATIKSNTNGFYGIY